MRGAAIAPGTSRPVTFAGSPNVTIPPGGSVMSDPAPLKVLAHQDVAVSLFVPGADVHPSEHGMALTTSYLTANGAGDATATEAAAGFTATTTAMFWLKAIDVDAPGGSAVVALGDSITDGFCSTVDGHDTWPDWLALRLDIEGKRHVAVLNEGINGNTLTDFGPGGSTPGLERFDRDVLGHHGVTALLLFIGTNDIRRGPPAATVIAGMETAIKRAKERNLRVYGVTIVPRHITPAPTAGNPGWTAEASKVRQEVNAWMRSQAKFDGIIDFDQAVRDPANPDLIRAPFNCDNIHLTPLGLYEAARAVRLDWLNARARK
jgi:lysophospholipase L1-like esterase